MSIGQIVVLLKVPPLEGEKGNSSFAARRRVAPFHRGPANNFRTFLIVRSRNAMTFLSRRVCYYQRCMNWLESPKIDISSVLIKCRAVQLELVKSFFQSNFYISINFYISNFYIQQFLVFLKI